MLRNTTQQYYIITTNSTILYRGCEDNLIQYYRTFIIGTTLQECTSIIDGNSNVCTIAFSHFGIPSIQKLVNTPKKYYSIKDVMTNEVLFSGSISDVSIVFDELIENGYNTTDIYICDDVGNTYDIDENKLYNCLKYIKFK